MGSQTKHPHQLKPSDEEIRALLRHLRKEEDPIIPETFMALHHAIIITIPGISFSIDLKDGQIDYGAKQYGYDGWGMVALAHHKAQV